MQHEAPQVSELDALRLEIAVLRAENAQLQSLVQQHFTEKYREHIKVLAKELERDGYQLTRVAEGAWVYQPLPPVKVG